MRETALTAKWLLRVAILAIGMTIGLALSSGQAFAEDGWYPDYDFTSPWVMNINPKDADTEGSVRLEADYFDDMSGVDPASVSLSVPDGEVSECTRTSNRISCKVSKLKPGDHDVTVEAKDRKYNPGKGNHKFRYEDRKPPVIDSITASTEEVSVIYHDPDPSKGIASVVIKVDGVELNCDTDDGGCEGHDDEYDHDDDDYYHDSLGNRHRSDGHFHDFDGYNHDEDEDGYRSNGYTCSIDTPLSCGTHQVEVIITDKGGNITTGYAVINNGVDCDPPTTVDNAPAGWQNTDVNVTLSCSDAGSGCAATTYEVNAGATQYGNLVSLSTDGIHTITYRSTDNAGLEEYTKTATVMIDKTPPEVTTSGDMTVEATGPSGATADFSYSATDALSGVSGITGCSPASGAIFPLGSSTVSCAATDAAGNTGTATLTVNVVDTTAPAVTYISPIDTIYDTTSPTITGTAIDIVGVASATVSIDGGAPLACTIAGDAITCSTADLGYGWHSAAISAGDAAGNTATASGNFCVSSGRPGLMLYKVKGPYIANSEDLAKRWVTVDYRMDNSGPDAYNVAMTSMTATNNVNLVYPLPLPLPLGNIPAATSATFSVKYFWPVGVTSTTFTNTACAEDQCSTVYIYSSGP